MDNLRIRHLEVQDVSYLARVSMIVIYKHYVDRIASLSSSSLILAYITAWLWSERSRNHSLLEPIEGLKPNRIV